jgi:hypothetical protein
MYSVSYKIPHSEKYIMHWSWPPKSGENLTNLSGSLIDLLGIEDQVYDR